MSSETLSGPILTSDGIPLKVKKPSGSMFKKSKFVINPVIVNSFNKRVLNKIAS